MDDLDISKKFEYFTFLVPGALCTGSGHVLAATNRVLLPRETSFPHQLAQRVPSPRRGTALRPKDGTLLLLRRHPLAWFKAPSIGEEKVEGAQRVVGQR